MTLHVYAQSHEHDEAYLIGTRNALLELRDAIDVALSNKARRRESASVADFFTSEGEGFSLYVKVVPESIESNLLLPYAELIGRSLGRSEEMPDLVPTE
jgi:hypothetical protein